MKTFDFISLAALVSAPTALGLVSFSPVANGPNYSVGLPPGTTIASSSPGTIYLSLEAPSTYQWAGLGIGEQMAGATIFMMYPNGEGNVTISARNGGGGHVEPQFNSTLMAGVTLLAGSGVDGDVMRANVKCTTCTLNAAATLSKCPWIAAYQPSGSLTSTDESFTLPMHDVDTMFQFTFDLTKATISSDSNPFVSGSGSSSSGGLSNGSSPVGSGGNGGSSFGGIPSDIELIPTFQKAHGILMGTSILLLFPIGAVFMRVVGSPLLHGIVQVLSLCVLIAGFGLGLRMAHILDILYKSIGRTHTIFGTVIVILFLLQPFIGLAHHCLYKKTGGRTPVSHIHIWLGRSILICGAVNGGLGLQLAANSRGGEIAWGVVAGVMALIYAAIVLVKRKSGKSLLGGRTKPEMTS